MRPHWLLLSFLGVFLFSAPAEAKKLLSWRFESDQNRLVFQTNEGVRPKAKLIYDPTRLVIDLPGTNLGRPTVNRNIGEGIQKVRVGQFKEQTTRIVVELTPGYTLNPEEVKVRGETPTQWSVQLPTPQRPTMPPVPTEQDNQPSPKAAASPTNTKETPSLGFQVTGNGLFVRLDGEEPEDIALKRSDDGRWIDIYLKDVTLPKNLVEQAFSLEHYNVTQVEFHQDSSSRARVSLKVEENSPGWNAFYSQLGGLVLLPKEGWSAGASNAESPSQENGRLVSNSASEELATIESVELTNDGAELLVKADQAVEASGTRTNGVYEITIPNAKLARPVSGPQWDADNPVSRVRVRQQDAETVVVKVQSAPGVKIEALNQPEKQLVALPLTRVSSRSISVPPPKKASPPAPMPDPSEEDVLVMVDPGHGGKDVGATGIGGLSETDIVLPISEHVAEFLREEGVQVKLTRTQDRFVSLEGRTEKANRADADLFVSIHANSINMSRPDVNGLETFYYSTGEELAQTIHKTILRSVDIKDRKLQRAQFYVLRNTSMPAVLVEVGFLTGREDAQKLKKPAFRRRMAEAIARGVLKYVQQNNL